MISFYQFAMVKICDNIKAVEGRKANCTEKQIALENTIDIDDSLAVFKEKECEEILTKTKLKFIERLLKSRGKTTSPSIRSLVDILFKGITEHEKYETEILRILKQLIDNVKVILSS